MKTQIGISKLMGLIAAMILAAGLILGLVASSAQAATWTVTNTNDGDGSANDITLRYAMTNAQAGDTINFAPSLSGRCYYTTDGTDPTTSSTRVLYTSPITISQPMTVRAANYYTATNSWSSVATTNFTTPLTDIPMLSLTGGSFAGGSFTSPQSLTMTKPEVYSSSQWGIGYTTDGSDPKTSTTLRLYSGPITVSQSMTVKTVILDILFFTPKSEVAAVTFSFNGVAPGGTPGISSPGGNFTPGQKICIYNRAGTIHLSRLLPAINKDLTINGPGVDQLTIDGNNLYRGFQVDGGSVSISNLTIANGKTAGMDGGNGEDGVAGGGGGGGAAGGGGGLLVRGGKVTVAGVTFLNNSAYGGNGGNGGIGWITGGTGNGGNGGTSELYPSSRGGTGNTLENQGDLYSYKNGANYGGGGGGYGRHDTANSINYSAGGLGAAGGSEAADTYGTAGAVAVPSSQDKHTNGTRGGNGGTGGYYGGNSDEADGGNGGNGGDGYGGAVCMTFGSLALVNCTFTGNQAVGGAGGHPGYSNFTSSYGPYHDLYYGCGGNGGHSRGGAIYIGSYVINSTSTVNIVNCTFNNNSVIAGPAGTAPITSFNYAFWGTVGRADFKDLCNYGQANIYATNNTGLVDQNATLLQPLVADITNSQVRVTSNSYITADGATTATIFVRLYVSGSAGSQSLFGALVTLSQGGGSSAITPASAITDSAGVANFTVTNTKVENVTYRATDAFGNTMNETATVHFQPGPVNSGKSTIVAGSLTVKADGTSTATITVTLKDSCGNPVGSNKQVTLSQNGSSVITPLNSGRTDSNSMVTFTVTDNVAQTVTYTAKDTTDNVTLTQTATIAFMPFNWLVKTLSDDGGTDTLRYMITNAPADATITFESGLAGTITLTSPLPVIAKNLTIYGPGADLLTINGNNQYRVFQVDSGTVSIKGLTVANGKVAGDNGTDHNDTGGPQSGKEGAGGGLLVKGGTVSIENVDFLNNQAIGGSGGNGIISGYSGASGGAGSGGAIYLTGGTLTIANSQFGGNWATGGNGGNGGSGGSYGGSGGGSGSGNGGAIYVNAGTLIVNNSRFSNGKATGGNGGSAGSGSTLNSNGSVGGDGNGGAIYVNAGSLTVKDSQFSNDMASGGKGGNGTLTIVNNFGANGGNGYGGAIYNNTGTLTNTGVQFSGDSVTGGTPGTSPCGDGKAGSGTGVDIYNKSGPISITNVTFGSGNNSYVNPSPAGAGQSTVTANLASVPGDGVTAATITVTLISANGSPLGYGRTVTLSAGSGISSISPAEAVTDSNGRAIFTVTDVHFETVIYTAKDTTDNVAISQTAMVTFNPVDCSVVNNLSDSGNYGTLRFAIDNAPAGTTITFLGGLTGTIKLTSMLPVINKNLTIDASGANVTISGQSLYRVLEVDGGTVIFKNLTVADGKTNESGGGLKIMNGAVTIDTVTFANNKAVGDNGYSPGNLGGDGGKGSAVNGGAIFIKDGSLTIKNSRFNGNNVIGGNGGYTRHGNGGDGGNGYGGAIFADAGTIVITNSQFSGDSSVGGNGGGTYWGYGGTAGSGKGGSVYINTGSLTITNSQFSGGTATAGNPGVANYNNLGGPGCAGLPGSAFGADLYNQNGTITVNDLTFTPGNNNYYNSIPADAGQSTVTAGSSSPPSDGATSATVTVTLKYADGSPGGSGKKVTLGQGSGRSTITPVNSGLTDNSGTATFTVTDTYTETVTYTATDEADSVTVSRTAAVTFLPPDAGLSTVTASPSSVRADASTASTITVTLKFANGNPAPGKKVTLSPGSGSSIITIVNNGITDSNGMATFTVTDAKAEIVTYTARDTTDNVPITQTEAVNFLPPDTGLSTVSVNPNSIIADATSSAKLTLTLKFANGNPAVGKMVTLTQGTGSSRISPESMVTDSNGKAIFTITGSKVETVTYTAKDTTDNIVVSQTSTVTFTSYAWIVNTLSDDNSLGTLRYAIANAPSGATITFRSGLTGTITLQDQLPAINKDLAIDGTGASVTISGNSSCRIFEVDGGTVSIKNFILTNGTVVGKYGSSSGVPGDPGRGGALLLAGGAVTINNISFNNNHANGGNGGSTSSVGTGGNGGNGEGGAVYIVAGSLTITSCRFIGNNATGGQGAAYPNSPTPLYGGNGGNGNGGAIFLCTGLLMITNCQFSGNSVTLGSYGIGNWGKGVNGGALGSDIYYQNGTVTLRNVAFDSVDNNSCYNLPSIYTVTFNSQGGSQVSSTISSSGFTISAPTQPTRLYYVFKGWYKESSCINAWNFSTDTVTGDITLYAKWAQSVVFPPSFTIPEGSYNTPQAVKIECDTTGAQIYYTTDGSTPSKSSARYDGTPVLIATSATLRAIACATGLDDSPVTSHTYTINGTDIDFQPGNNDPPTSPKKLFTAHTYEGDVAVQFNSEALWLGKGKTGKLSDIWLYYPQLFGTGSNQIPNDAKIVNAQLVLTVKSFNGNPYSAHKIDLYQITDPDSKGVPFYGESGIRNGLDYQYRDHRLGRNIPWKNPAVAGGKDTTIGDLVKGTTSVDSYEFIPAVFNSEQYTQIFLDVTASLNSWLSGSPQQGWFLRGDQTSNWSVDDGVEFYGASDATLTNRPKLVVTYLSTSGDNNPPGSVTSFNATPDSGQVTLSWDNPADTDFSGVLIRRKKGAIPADPTDGTLVSDGKTSSFIDTGVENGQIYYYSVFAYDSLRNYSQKRWIKVIPGNYNSLPSAPENLQYTLSGRNVILSWTDKSNNESEFRIYRDLTSTIPIKTVTANQTTFTDLEVVPGNYTYKVLAHNTTGDSSYITVNVVVPALPDAPKDLKWNIISSSEVRLSWTNDTTVTYRVEIIDENGNVRKENPASSNGSGTYLYSVRGLAANVGYHFRVVAINTVGKNQVESDEVKTSPDPKPIFF